MTTGQKWLGLLLLQAGLLGGAYGGGRYPEWKKRQVFEETARKDKEKLEEAARRALLITRARSMLMEAALAVQYHNHGMAFERVIRAQGAVQNLKLPLQKEFDEISALLIAQKPEALDKILLVADKIEPPPRLVPPPELSTPSKPAAAMVPTAAQPVPAISGTPAAPAAPAPAAPHPAGPASATPSEAAPRPAPAAAPVLLPAASPPSPASVPARNSLPEVNIEQSRTALLFAKEMLIVGGESPAVITKLAHAQVVLEESGHSEFGDQFAAAIKAVRSHDDQKARTTLDELLARLRGL